MSTKCEILGDFHINVPKLRHNNSFFSSPRRIEDQVERRGRMGIRRGFRIVLRVRISVKFVQPSEVYISGVRTSVIRHMEKVKPRWRKLTSNIYQGRKQF